MPVLEARDVRVEFGGLVALNGVNLSVDGGSSMGLIGPNGAGKSTLFGVLSGAIHPTAGSIGFDGRDVTRLPAWKRARLGMARTFQLGGLVPDLTAAENVALGFDQKSRIAHKRLSARGLRKAAFEALAELGLDASADALCGSLPAGTQREVEVVRAVSSGAKLVLLDEPGAGLSLQELRSLSGLLSRLTASGVAVVLCDHAVDFVMSTVSQVTVLNLGSVVSQGPVDVVRRDQTVLDAYIGRNSDAQSIGGV